MRDRCIWVGRQDVGMHGAIVAALNDVPRISGNGQVRSAGHGEDSVAKRM